jgi:hypothetical protein
MNQNVKTLTLIVGTLLGAFLGYRAALNFVTTARQAAHHGFAGSAIRLNCCKRTQANRKNQPKSRISAGTLNLV